MQQRISEFPANANYTIGRFKGLGEMMRMQLWDTTMNPETRTFKQVEIEDAAEADRIFTVLMGDRKESFLTRNFVNQMQKVEKSLLQKSHSIRRYKL